MPAKKQQRHGVARDSQFAGTASPAQRKIGLFAGQIRIAPDFDETSGEIIRAFEGAFDDG